MRRTIIARREKGEKGRPSVRPSVVDAASDNERLPRDGSPFNPSLLHLAALFFTNVGSLTGVGQMERETVVCPGSPRFVRFGPLSSAFCRASFSILQLRASGAFAKIMRLSSIERVERRRAMF